MQTQLLLVLASESKHKRPAGGDHVDAKGQRTTGSSQRMQGRTSNKGFVPYHIREGTTAGSCLSFHRKALDRDRKRKKCFPKTCRFDVLPQRRDRSKGPKPTSRSTRACQLIGPGSIPEGIKVRFINAIRSSRDNMGPQDQAIHKAPTVPRPGIIAYRCGNSLFVYILFNPER